jgi:cytochrome c-type biogenesis protein CcmH
MKTKTSFLVLINFLLILGAIIPFRTVSAQQPTPSDDDVNIIASQLYCPVCENTPLDVCPTTACHQWRELIRQMLAEGKSETEIKQYFVEYYGARVLAEPPRTGINWLAYIVPPIVFLIGVFSLFRAFQSWKQLGIKRNVMKGEIILPKSSSQPDKELENIDTDVYITRLEEELKKRK